MFQQIRLLLTSRIGRSAGSRDVRERPPVFGRQGHPNPCSVVLTTSRVAPARPRTSCLRMVITNPSRSNTQSASNLACTRASSFISSHSSGMQAANPPSKKEWMLRIVTRKNIQDPARIIETCVSVRLPTAARGRIHLELRSVRMMMQLWHPRSFWEGGDGDD